MNCMNCGAFLVDKDLDYCPKCGCNVLIQKKVDYLSRQYYNRGLEKASVRDLSGAIDCLKQSLIYNKHNIQARNLLGLVYFETGEVVAALSEWGGRPLKSHTRQFFPAGYATGPRAAAQDQ